MKAQILVLFMLMSSFAFKFTAVKASIPTYGKSHFTFTYKVTVNKPEKAFSKINVWLPIAQDSVDQKVVISKIITPLKYDLGQETHFGNKMLFAQIDAQQQLPATIEVNYEITRSAARPIATDKMIESQYWQPDHFLGVDRKIPINGKIATIAAKQTQGLKTDDEKIRAIYKYVTESMTYSKEGTGWGEGDAQWACDSKRGNCTDFHSLLIGMARSQKIPARFEIGFPVGEGKGGAIAGYHCWAWIFSTKDHQWMPLDSSEAKKAGKLFEYLGYMPENRLAFTTGRDIVLSPPQAGLPLNYFIFPYAELDGKAYAQIQKDFSYNRLD